MDIDVGGVARIREKVDYNLAPLSHDPHFDEELVYSLLGSNPGLLSLPLADTPYPSTWHVTGNKKLAPLVLCMLLSNNVWIGIYKVYGEKPDIKVVSELVPKSSPTRLRREMSIRKGGSANPIHPSLSCEVVDTFAYIIYSELKLCDTLKSSFAYARDLWKQPLEHAVKSLFTSICPNPLTVTENYEGKVKTFLKYSSKPKKDSQKIVSIDTLYSMKTDSEAEGPALPTKQFIDSLIFMVPKCQYCKGKKAETVHPTYFGPLLKKLINPPVSTGVAEILGGLSNCVLCGRRFTEKKTIDSAAAVLPFDLSVLPDMNMLIVKMGEGSEPSSTKHSILIGSTCFFLPFSNDDMEFNKKVTT